MVTNNSCLLGLIWNQLNLEWLHTSVRHLFNDILEVGRPSFNIGGTFWWQPRWKAMEDAFHLFITFVFILYEKFIHSVAAVFRSRCCNKLLWAFRIDRGSAVLQEPSNLQHYFETAATSSLVHWVTTKGPYSQVWDSHCWTF